MPKKDLVLNYLYLRKLEFKLMNQFILFRVLEHTGFNQIRGYAVLPFGCRLTEFSHSAHHLSIFFHVYFTVLPFFFISTPFLWSRTENGKKEPVRPCTDVLIYR